MFDGESMRDEWATGSFAFAKLLTDLALRFFCSLPVGVAILLRGVPGLGFGL